MEKNTYSSIKTYNNFNSLWVKGFISYEDRYEILTASQGLIALLDIEVDFVGHFGPFCSLYGLRAEERRNRDDDERDRDSAEHGGYGIKVSVDVESQDVAK